MGFLPAFQSLNVPTTDTLRATELMNVKVTGTGELAAGEIGRPIAKKIPITRRRTARLRMGDCPPADPWLEEFTP
jgi:hypothetical protein